MQLRVLNLNCNFELLIFNFQLFPMIYLGSDHRGYSLKEELREYLLSKGHKVADLGNTEYDPADDYPDFARKVAEKVAEGPADHRGILLCGSGVGVDVVANKFKGVRSALVWKDDEALVRQSRLHDDSNVLSLPADHLTPDQAKNIVRIWLETPGPSEERHLRRLGKIKEIEERSRHPLNKKEGT